MIASICWGVLVTAEIRPVVLTGNWWPLERWYVHVSLSLVRPSGCSQVKVAGVDGLDDLAGVGLAEGVGIGSGRLVVGGEVGGAPSVDQLLLVVGGWVIELLKGPVAGGDAALKQGLHGGEIKGLFHDNESKMHIPLVVDGFAW
jgi:hypothetical protein